MESYTLPELLWAVAVVLWPVCLVVIVVILKREISKLLLEISGRIKKTEEQSDITEELVLPSPPIQTPEPTPPEPESDPLIEVVRNSKSGKYFIVLDDDSFYVITPKGEFIHPERRFFDDIEELGIDELRGKDLLSQIQVDKYFEYIINSYGPKPPPVYVKPHKEPIYIKSYRNMLSNPNSMPSRMLKYISKNRQTTWSEVKQHLGDKYGYSISSGSISASLAVLRIDRYIDVYGLGEDKTILYIRDTHKNPFVIISNLKREISKRLLEISGRIKKTEEQAPEPSPPGSESDPLIEVVKNYRSGKYFIVLDDVSFYVITPKGKLNYPERKFFDEVEELGIDELRGKDLLSQIQVDKYFEYITNYPAYIGDFIKMLENPDTMPSRMLKYIATERQTTWSEIKQHLVDTYGYSIYSGSLSASLAVLRKIQYVDVYGRGEDKTILYIRDTHKNPFENTMELYSNNSERSRYVHSR